MGSGPLSAKAGKGCNGRTAIGVWPGFGLDLGLVRVWARIGLRSGWANLVGLQSGMGRIWVSKGRLARQVGWVGVGFGIRWCGQVGLWLESGSGGAASIGLVEFG